MWLDCKFTISLKIFSSIQTIITNNKLARSKNIDDKKIFYKIICDPNFFLDFMYLGPKKLNNYYFFPLFIKNFNINKILSICSNFLNYK